MRRDAADSELMIMLRTHQNTKHSALRSWCLFFSYALTPISDQMMRCVNLPMIKRSQLGISDGGLSLSLSMDISPFFSQTLMHDG